MIPDNVLAGRGGIQPLPACCYTPAFRRRALNSAVPMIKYKKSVGKWHSRL